MSRVGSERESEREKEVGVKNGRPAPFGLESDLRRSQCPVLHIVFLLYRCCSPRYPLFLVSVLAPYVRSPLRIHSAYSARIKQRIRRTRAPRTAPKTRTGNKTGRVRQRSASIEGDNKSVITTFIFLSAAATAFIRRCAMPKARFTAHRYFFFPFTSSNSGRVPFAKSLSNPASVHVGSFVCEKKKRKKKQ